MEKVKAFWDRAKGDPISARYTPRNYRRNVRMLAWFSGEPGRVPWSKRRDAVAVSRGASLSLVYATITKKGGTKFWFYGLRNSFISVSERDSMLPRSLTKRLVNYASSGDVLEGDAADWTVEQLRAPAQQVVDRIDNLSGTASTQAIAKLILRSPHVPHPYDETVSLGLQFANVLASEHIGIDLSYCPQLCVLSHIIRQI